MRKHHLNEQRFELSIYLHRNFLLTWTADFISLFGSKLLIMAYVAHIYYQGHSAKLAASVFVVEWSMSIVVGIFGTRIVDRSNARKLFIGVNLLSAFITLFFMFFTKADQVAFALIIIGMRAYLSHTLISTKMKALFQFFDDEERKIFTPIINSSLIIATALAGAIGVTLLNFLDFSWMVVIDSSTFIIAAGLLFFVKPLQRIEDSIDDTKKESWIQHVSSTTKIILSNRRLRNGVFYIMMTASFFQGTYSVLLAAVPQTWFDLSKSGTALYFSISSIFITLGAFFYQYLNRRKTFNKENEQRYTVLGITIAAVFYLLVAASKYSFAFNIIAFSFMVLLYEMVWVHQYNRIVESADPKKAARISGLQMGVGYTLMAVASYSSSWLIDQYGITFAICSVVAVLAVTVVAWEFFSSAFDQLVLNVEK